MTETYTADQAAARQLIAGLTPGQLKTTQAEAQEALRDSYHRRSDDTFYVFNDEIGMMALTLLQALGAVEGVTITGGAGAKVDVQRLTQTGLALRDIAIAFAR